jgi:hypothetical protein
MDASTIDELYFQWLYGQVGSESNQRARTHWNLLKRFHETPFVWTVPNDDNRAEDGRDLRREFIENENIEVDPDWMSLQCSMLELLIGLSRRLAFEDDGTPRRWFWQLVENLNLAQYTDKARLPVATVDEALNRVIFRQYNFNGIGGLFPLRNPTQDQRKVELWYQLSAYLLDED